MSIAEGLQILEEVADRGLRDSRCAWPLQELITVSTKGGNDLARARLVNKSFHDCATPLLFREVNARFPNSASRVAPSTWARRLMELSSSPLVEHVESLKFGFHSSSNPALDLIDDFLLEGVYVIPTLVSACKRLRVLDMKGRSTVCDKSHYPYPLVGSHIRMYLQIVDQAFRFLCKTTDRLSLDNLVISLPLSHDYGDRMYQSTQYHHDIIENPLTRLLKTVRHLDVAILDDSGANGRRDMRLSDSDGHKRYPNQSYQAEFWHFIQHSAPGLQSLKIRCTHILDLDLLSIDTLHCLRELELSRVQFSASQFQTLVNQNFSTLRAIEITLVQLHSGTWESILLQLCDLPRLEKFHMDSCGYTTSGDSHMYAIRQSPLIDEPDEPQPPQSIETYNTDDICALAHLQRRVDAFRIAAGISPYREADPAHLASIKLLDEFSFVESDDVV